MQPPLSTPTDELEAQNAIRVLATQIGEAVAQADINRVRQLSLCRHNLLRKVCGPDGPVHFTDSQLAELIRESEEWVAALQTHQDRIAAMIGRLRVRRNTKRIVTQAYRAAPPSTIAQCFAHRG